jgi:hypothetical protein
MTDTEIMGECSRWNHRRIHRQNLFKIRLLSVAGQCNTCKYSQLQ